MECENDYDVELFDWTISQMIGRRSLPSNPALQLTPKAFARHGGQAEQAR